MILLMVCPIHYTSPILHDELLGLFFQFTTKSVHEQDIAENYEPNTCPPILRWFELGHNILVNVKEVIAHCLVLKVSPPSPFLDCKFNVPKLNLVILISPIKDVTGRSIQTGYFLLKIGIFYLC